MNTLICPNCNNERDGAFCSRCGQNARDYRKSLPPMVWELITEAFELDGRIFRSLRLLVAQPGALTTAFSANRRADYVSPLRLYIFASLLFFFIFTQLAQSRATSDQVDIDSEKQELTTDNVKWFKQLLGAGYHTPIDTILSREGSIGREIVIAVMDGGQADYPDANDVPAANRFLYTQIVTALADPGRTFENFLENSPLAMFFLLPVYALMLKLLYIRKRLYYVEHLVFALHLHAFAFFVFTAIALIPDTPPWTENLKQLLTLCYFVYYFMALRGYYQQSRRKTALKFVLLCAGYTLMVTPSILLVMATTVTFL